MHFTGTRPFSTAIGLLAVISPCIAAQAQSAPASAPLFKFAFGSGKSPPGYTPISPTSIYTKDRGYGFSGPGVTAVSTPGPDVLNSQCCTSDKPFFFGVDLPEGNYDVILTLGNPKDGSETTVKAEARRLLVEDVHTSAGHFGTRTCTVNVRQNILKTGEKVRLKADEQGHLDWDGRLTFEFSNKRPCISALEIRKSTKAVTLFIAGDSTVCDQGKEPWCGWGQMLPRFFKRGVTVANYAESGESLRSFISEKRLQKVLETIKSGDYLFIQFGHNDMKQRGEGVGAFTTYKADLKFFISEARSRGATAVLVTPMNRRTFDDSGTITNSLGNYPEAVRQAAREESVPLIDLNTASKALYEALGPDKSTRAFVHYPAGTFPGQDKELKDNTHFNSYGAYELARCIVEGIRSSKLSISQFLTDDTGSFDPAHPDPVASWHLPPSPLSPLAAPVGR